MDEDATMTDAAAEEFLGGVAAHVARRRSSEAAAAHGRPRSSAGHGDASAASRSHGPAAAAFLNTPASIEKQVEAVGVVDTNVSPLATPEHLVLPCPVRARRATNLPLNPRDFSKWLCNHRDLLIAFVGLEPANCRLIIPYMVIQEIDAFKKAVPSRRHKGTAPPGNAAGLETRAYRSNLLLYQLFSQHNPYVQGQKVYEYLEHSQPNDTPDDIILDCARFQQLFRAEKVTLLTDDKNLRVKALVHGIAIVERTPPNAKALLDALLNPSIPLAADDPRRRLPTAACASRARPPRSVPSVSRCERDWSSTSVRGAAASTTGRPGTMELVLGLGGAQGRERRCSP
ncbi:MAG: PIN domain-containing protein [Olpidium bornovanus]|uniref:PIN domain-containing protein n=1 Tax=Olpidium bornovanus TaxID=278681 RepID=A0A8H7ZLY3_9FUNG|nr:MAG: PIN domain-containing protein [Olpidium bornovanus]